jgi:hypothetical protein
MFDVFLFFIYMQFVGYKLVVCLSIKVSSSFIKYVPSQKTFEITDTCFNEVSILLTTSIFC